MIKTPVRRALVSVYDKEGLEDLAAGLNEAGVEVVSTGSTAARIAAAGVPVTAVSDVTGFPECLEGGSRRCTRRSTAASWPIVANPTTRRLLRNWASHRSIWWSSTLPLSTPSPAARARTSASSRSISAGRQWCARRPRTIRRWPSWCRRSGMAKPWLRCATAGSHWSSASSWRSRRSGTQRPMTSPWRPGWTAWSARMRPRGDARLGGRGLGAGSGAALRRESASACGVVRFAHRCRGLAHAEQLHGKEMSYNNYVDADAAYRSAYDFDLPAVAIIKHANPCGIAVGEDIAEAHRKAHETDPVSAFGGVIATNREVSAAMAAQVAEVFTEVIVAPSYEGRGAGDADREEEPAHPGRRTGAGRGHAGDQADQWRTPAPTARPHRCAG